MSLRQAINNKCKECIYDSEQPGSWRQQVVKCTSISCPLYQFRPKPLSSPRHVAIVVPRTEKGPNQRELTGGNC